EKLSELIALMTVYAPQIDYLIFCTDYTGAFAYLLSRENPGDFPTVTRFRNTKVIRSATTKLTPPDDPSSHWHEFEGSSFRKPAAGMVELVQQKTYSTRIVGVWEREEDYEALTDDILPIAQSVGLQSAKFWRERCDQWGTDSSSPKQVNSAAPAKTAVQTTTDPRTQWKHFRSTDLSINSDKFWDIRMTDNLLGYVVRHGRWGTAGRELNPKMFATQKQATIAYDTIIHEKRRKGYQPIP
ncbi:MAG TPA: WGR domain-containing protein, partial [Thermosynechococcaceae cyanobacterium]